MCTQCLWQSWQWSSVRAAGSSLQPSWFPNLFLCRCGAGAGLLTLPRFPIRLWVLAVSSQLYLGFKPVFK